MATGGLELRGLVPPTEPGLAVETDPGVLQLLFEPQPGGEKRLGARRHTNAILRAMSQRNVEIVRRGFEEFRAGFARGDPGAAFDSGVLAPDAEWMLPPDTAGFRQVYRGREEFLEFMRTWTEDFDWSIELERVVDAGEDRVVAVTHQRATGKASGAPVELRMGAVWELRDGQVVRIRNYFDPADALEAAGLSD